MYSGSHIIARLLPLSSALTNFAAFPLFPAFLPIFAFPPQLHQAPQWLKKRKPLGLPFLCTVPVQNQR
ncbi:hypothetical protein GCWU000342_01732 [Shuttleworthella satelles DSM 14600]|uniref:Uncharacterized protein n=1 Tax=Shuttleworthella satelles DSM 14600 TaxID=626523 RepID=C4GCN8_9FIRM|nr:hypothetical protein GCWU000342_01732 [Shuttleworthia satelles DSM 14600]